MNLRDRLSGAVADLPPTPTHFGRWLFEVGDGGPVHHNGCLVADGDVLVPGATSHWALVRPGDATPVRGRFFADETPSEQDATAIQQLGRLLTDPDKAAGGWLEWSDTSPLAPGLDKAVEAHPLEDHIENELKHLAGVCRNPSTHIRIETERVLVSRARRIAPDAPLWLAAHTEDWDHRKISGIQPRRILAEVREEQWDLYENRVAVRLVDNLVTWLRRRIADVRRVLNDIFARLEEFGVSTAGNRHRTERICRLWGEAWDATHGREAAERTLERLEQILYKTLALMDSPLYRHVPRRAQVPRALRMTNLLSNDDGYRGVARLWHHWSRLAAPRALSPRELYVQRQEIHRGFDAWCMLVAVRACSQLGLEPAVDAGFEVPLLPGCHIPLEHECRIEWECGGAVTLAGPAGVLLRLVPVAHVLEQATTSSGVSARIASLAEAVTESSTAPWTVVLHPAVPGAPEHEALAGLGNPPAPGTKGALDFIRVSPFSLESVERVARAIRWATLAPRMMAYPPTLPAGAMEEEHDSSWHDERGSAGWALVRPLRRDELSRLDIPAHVEAARARRDGLSSERNEVQDELRRVRGDRRKMAELNRRKGELLKPLQDAEDDLERLEAFGREFERAHKEVVFLATCPACGSDAAFEPRANDCFAARCRSSSCSASWELRFDPAHGSRIPIFLPGGTTLDLPPFGVAPQWVDDVLGCDVLAVPFLRADGSVAFLAPRESKIDAPLDLVRSS